MTGDLEAGLRELVRPGMRVTVADACGTPRALHGPLSRAAAAVGDVRLVLGWLPGPVPDIDATAFADVRSVVGGPGARRMIDAGDMVTVPCRLSATPALMSGPLLPDLLLATVVRDADGLRFGAETSWMRTLVAAGVPVAAVESTSAPHAEDAPPLPPGSVTVLGEVGGDEGAPAEIPTPPPTADDEAIAAHVAGLVPSGARIQFGPGRLAVALVSALRVPVRVDSGLLSDPVVDLDERGLLHGTPTATALHGTRRLYDWAHGRPCIRPIEYTHDISRLSGGPDDPPLVALNAALEIDADGQVNVEGIGDAAAGMIGGHPDFAAAAARGAGLSVIALPTAHRGRPTLVERLSRPASTPSHDVDVVVTERGVVDLRGLGRAERRRALTALWNHEQAP